MKILWMVLVIAGLGLELASFARGEDIPADFPRFEVPGHDAAMSRLRELFHLHYEAARPLATRRCGTAGFRGPRSGPTPTASRFVRACRATDPG